MVRDLNQGVGDPEAALIADLLSEGVVRRAGMTALLNIIAGQPSYDVGDKLMGRICENVPLTKRRKSLEEPTWTGLWKP